MKLTYILAAALCLSACNTKDGTDSTTSGTNTEYINRTDTVYLTRNADITPANSYSDLFLDTMAIDRFIGSNNAGDEEQKSLRSFYNYRNLQYAWFTSQGFTEQAKGFWNLQDELGSKADKALRNKMDTLLNNDSLVISRFDTSILQTELALTKAYLDFYKNHRGKTHFAGISPEKAIPVKKLNPLALADSILAQRSDSAITANSSQYARLKQKLQAYVAIAKQGGNNAPLNTSLRSARKGSSSPAISQLKVLLQRTGDMKNTDTSAVFNDSLVSAIKTYQQQNGMRPTGTITDSMIRLLNVPADTRIRQIIVNLYRAQWMPVNQDANYISVNIPDFLMTVYENNAKVFDMPVAVGKQGTGTTMFTGDLNQIVFSPYWNVPRSIVQNEILPKMNADKNYLKSKNMEVVGNNTTNPTIRQLPGKDNALGKVKFLFPNRYDIYFHDTYEKGVFNRSNRAVSHGCIRLQDAEKLATYLLRNNNAWTPEKIKAAMNANKEQFVKLDQAVPVTITYYTAWVDDSGMMRFRDDLYGNDSRTMQMLFEPTSMAVGTTPTDTIKVTRDTSKRK